jgi:predicted anti-sigma-YlaC factor YlaD
MMQFGGIFMYVWLRIAGVIFIGGLLCCCSSIKTLTVSKIGDALAGGGSLFSTDDDPDLIKAAAPFSLKMMEGLLQQTPNHKGLLLACSSGFTQYAFAFVASEADQIEDVNLEKATELRSRSKRLYLRARKYGLRGLEVDRPGFENVLRKGPKEAVNTLALRDVPLMYWTAISWVAATSVVKDDADLIADLPIVEALIYRALELDEKFNNGAIHSFLIAYEMGNETGGGDPEKKAREHFRRAVELSRGQLAGPFVSLAESVSVAQQDKTEFQDLLGKALQIKVDEKPEFRLENLLIQRRARWLLSRENQLFVD